MSYRPAAELKILPRALNAKHGQTLIYMQFDEELYILTVLTFYPNLIYFSLFRENYLKKNRYLINRPGVAGGVLQTPPSFIHSFIH